MIKTDILENHYCRLITSAIVDIHGMIITIGGINQSFKVDVVMLIFIIVVPGSNKNVNDIKVTL